MCSIQKDASALLLPPTRATHGRCVLCHLCRELWRGCAQVCTVRVSVVHGVHSVPRMSLALTAVFSECFAKCAHICRMCRTLSQNSTRLGIRLTTRTSCARIRKNSSGKDFSLGSKSEPWRQNPGAFPSGGKSGDFSGGARGRPGADLAIWPNLAPRRLF